jgi:O-antigen ligase
MISGDRGPILTIVLTLLGAIIIGTQTKIKFATIVFAIFLGATFISLLGVIRNMDTRISFEDRMSQAIEDESVDNRYKSVLPATAELSTSVRTLHFALEQVPARHDYFLGIFQVREALKVIPFAAGIFDPLFPAHFSYKNSAYFITWIDKGENYRSGAGSSINADLYLSFGEIGVVIFLFLLGRLFRRIDLFVFSEYGKHINVLQVVLMVSILGSSIYWSRASLLTPIQSIALTYILVIMYRKIVLKQTS